MDFRKALLVLGLAWGAFGNYQADVETLQLVQVIFRHGDRAPTNSYPNDPISPDSWPEGLAQLTSIGKMQQYNLGQYLRKRYAGFIAEKYHAEEIYVVSSDMDRTIMSVESNLAGLFPPVHKWHPLIDWQPIPLRTIPWKEDTYLHVNTKCPKYEKLHRDFLQNSDVVRSVNEENLAFVSYLADQSGIKASTVKEIIVLQDIILTEWLHNLSVPQWALNALPRLTSLQAEVNTWNTYTDEMKRLRGGPLLDLLIKNMLAKTGALDHTNTDERKHMVVGGGKRKMLLYSAHDSTLARIMNTIGIFYPHNPAYASALMLELHWDLIHSDHYVKIFYRNDTTRVPHELPVPSCTSPCYLVDLIKVTEHLIPRDLEGECLLEDVEEDPTAAAAAAAAAASNPLRLGSGGHYGAASCVSYTYPDPIVAVIVGLILFLLSFVMWACLFKILGCSRLRENEPICYSEKYTYELL